LAPFSYSPLFSAYPHVVHWSQYLREISRISV
jgi:hypothetical protein